MAWLFELLAVLLLSCPPLVANFWCCCRGVQCGGHCLTEPDEFQVVIAGVVDGTCSTCDTGLNGTFVLEKVSSGLIQCVWNFSTSAICLEFASIDLFISTTNMSVVWNASSPSLSIGWGTSSFPGGNCEDYSGVDVPYDAASPTTTCNASASTCTITAL